MTYRIEKDSMGEFRVPEAALYGAQTARAIENFPMSTSGGVSTGIGRELVRALGMIKSCAARVNQDLGLIPADIAEAIADAAREVIEGSLDDHFPVDIFQTGSGTSSNMNANEVISNRAIQILGGTVGTKTPVHPNDHVNFGQSSNDVFPTAIHIAALTRIETLLVPALTRLEESFRKKAHAFDEVVKIGRTHLQDAVPIRLGQIFSGYATQIAHGIKHLHSAREHLREIAQGGTALGTGLNTHPEFGQRMAAALTTLSGVKFIEAPNHFEAQSAQDASVQCSGALKTIASSLLKIANDIRFLASGPRLGLGELTIPAVQPGSSIMPGKVNPVIAESLIMACAQVMGNDNTITLGGLYGNFELNVMLPVIARNLLESITLIGNGADMFREKLVEGITANRDRIEAMNEQSLSLATSLAPLIGYDAAAALAKASYQSGRTIREIAFDEKVLPPEQLTAALDLYQQTLPGIPGQNSQGERGKD